MYVEQSPAATVMARVGGSLALLALFVVLVGGAGLAAIDRQRLVR